MAFNSVDYILLLALTAAAFYRLGELGRLLLLAAASLFFYAVWSIPLTSLILISAAVDYSAGRALERAPNLRRRRLFLALSLATNLGLLGYFKYSNFFIENINAATGGSYSNLIEVVLPPGISFYTFQTMSYTIDVYRGKLRAEKSWWKFLVYVSFFPQLVAGPIERAGNILGQLDRAVRARFSTDDLAVGLRLITWGLFKKVMIADHVGVLADRVYADPESATMWAFLVGTYAFTLQIYCDFSAYSEIARGSARIFGIRLMRNFDQPYLVENVRDFWRRWHISLSTWFRDYVYRALGGNHGSRARTLINLTATMFVSGLWHGAAWNFVVWGLYHGVLLVAHQLVSTRAWFVRLMASFGRVAPLLRWFVTFHFVVFGWVLFRISAFSDLGVFAKGIAATVLTVAPTATQLLFIASTFGFVLLSALERRHRLFERLHADHALSVLFYTAVAAIALLLGREAGGSFIYFQF